MWFECFLCRSSLLGSYLLTPSSYSSELYLASWPNSQSLRRGTRSSWFLFLALLCRALAANSPILRQPLSEWPSQNSQGCNGVRSPSSKLSFILCLEIRDFWVPYLKRQLWPSIGRVNLTSRLYPTTASCTIVHGATLREGWLLKWRWFHQFEKTRWEWSMDAFHNNHLLLSRKTRTQLSPRGYILPDNLQHSYIWGHKFLFRDQQIPLWRYFRNSWGGSFWIVIQPCNCAWSFGRWKFLQWFLIQWLKNY